MAGGLLSFIMTWNNFLFAFLLTSTTNVKTLPVIMRQFALGEPAVRWELSTLAGDAAVQRAVQKAVAREGDHRDEIGREGFAE